MNGISDHTQAVLTIIGSILTSIGGTTIAIQLISQQSPIAGVIILLAGAAGLGIKEALGTKAAAVVPTA